MYLDVSVSFEKLLNFFLFTSTVRLECLIFQALQEECDKMTDELEIKLGEIKELKKIIRESDENNENLKLQCSEIKKNLASSEKMIDLLQNDKIE